MSEHLWETKHPYYWSEGCYHEAGYARRYLSWAEFFAEWKEADEDYNAVYRWDWTVDEDTGVHTLMVFMVAQRKGFTFSHDITVTPADELAVRVYLERHWRRVQAVWAPLGAEPADHDALAREFRAQRAAALRAELAALEAAP